MGIANAKRIAAKPHHAVAHGRKIHDRFESVQAQLSEMNVIVQESLSGARVVRALCVNTGGGLRYRVLIDRGRDVWLLHRSGGYREFIKDAERFGVAERVVATDAVHPHQQLPLDYQAADVFVQASRAEGLGFAPLEALACGTPVVAAAVGGLKETIRDKETGWSYPAGDVDWLARSIAARSRQCARRLTMGTQTRNA